MFPMASPRIATKGRSFAKTESWAQEREQWRGGQERSRMSKVKRSDRARSLNTPDARRYTEWVLLVKDVEYALRRATLWRDMARSDKGDAGDIELRVSLFRDAVVSLVACFDDTSPVHLDPDRVYGETPGGAEYFQWLKNIRHTWIGHRGGPLRQCVVAVVLDESTGDFRGIGHLSQVWLNPKAEAGDDLVRMMEIALIHARRELERCGSVVQDYVERMTSRERLQLPVARTIAPGPLDIHMGRRKFHNIKNASKVRTREKH